MEAINIQKFSEIEETNKQLKRIADQVQWSNWLKCIELAQTDGYIIDDRIWERVENGIGIGKLSK